MILSNPLPVASETFWENRLEKVKQDPKNLHRCIYEVDRPVWDDIQMWHKRTLESLLVNTKVLDAGCGYGAMTEILPQVQKYVGVDQSKALLKAMDSLYPSYANIQAKLDNLPFEDYEFDWVVCRSIKKMILDNVGEEAWLRIEIELLRVARKLLILEYEDPQGFSIVRSGHARHKKLLRLRDRWSGVSRIAPSELPDRQEKLSSASVRQPDQRVEEAHPQKGDVPVVRYSGELPGTSEDSEAVPG
jgi:SAM-dependent methyltransferase